MAEPAKHYTVRRLADKWDVSQSHVYDLIDRKELKALKIGKAIRIPQAYIDEYEAEHHTWDDPKESESNTGLDESAEAPTGTSAGQRVVSLSANQRARLSAQRHRRTLQTSSPA